MESTTTALDAACLGRGEAAFGKAFGKAEQKGGCATTGDGAALDGAIDGFADQVLTQLVPAATIITTPSTTSTTMGSGVATIMVGQGGLVFAPEMRTVKVGETVRWVWATSFHSVVSGTPGSPDGKFCSPSDANCASAPTSNAGEEYQHTFTQAGRFPYYCGPHGSLGMVGTIVVEP